MWTIEERDGRWVLVRAGEDVATFDGYQAALDHLAGLLAEADMATPEPGADGTLAERWVNAAGQGIAYARETGDGRDMTGVEWSWRDPTTNLLPLMLQTRTDMGHFGAEVAGWIDTLGVDDDAVTAGGGFYDSEVGRQARDLLLGGRLFGVSVDGGEVDVEFDCVEFDDDGWCLNEVVRFRAYQIIGLTMTPFPAFDGAAITLEGAETAQEPVSGDPDADGADTPTPAVAAVSGGSGASRGPLVAAAARAAFDEPEPDLGDDRLVAQPGGGWAVPLTITDDRRVYGHLASWETCHTGIPGRCVTAPPSPTRYARFHLGVVDIVDGPGGRAAMSTGPVVVGCDHAALGLFADDARDHYAHHGLGWGDVRVVDGQFGPWVAGIVRPQVTDEQIDALRASAWSGDWRVFDGELDLVAILTVNTPGFPISREAALAASALGDHRPVDAAGTRARVAADGAPRALVASGVVHRCATCAGARSESVAEAASLVAALARIEDRLAVLDRRTAHLADDARHRIAERIAAARRVET